MAVTGFCGVSEKAFFTQRRRAAKKGLGEAGLSGLDPESCEQAAFTQAGIGCDDGGGACGDRGREVKRVEATESHRAARESQAANEVHSFVSNFGAQRRQDDPASGAISIETCDRPLCVGPGNVTETFLAVQRG
jgi:hypothetical protein